MNIFQRINADKRNMRIEQIHTDQSSKCFNFTLGYLIINGKVQNMSRWMNIFNCFSSKSISYEYFSNCEEVTLAYAIIDNRDFSPGFRL